MRTVTIEGHPDGTYNGVYLYGDRLWGFGAYSNCYGNWFYYREDGIWTSKAKYYFFHHTKPLTNENY